MFLVEQILGWYSTWILVYVGQKYTFGAKLVKVIAGV